MVGGAVGRRVSSRWSVGGFNKTLKQKVTKNHQNIYTLFFSTFTYFSKNLVWIKDCKTTFKLIFLEKGRQYISLKFSSKKVKFHAENAFSFQVI